MNYELLKLDSHITTDLTKHSKVNLLASKKSKVTTLKVKDSYIADNYLTADAEKDFFIFKILISSTYSFTLPLRYTGTYNFKVDWGDGSSSLITSYNDPNKTHVYTSNGEKVISCHGTYEGVYAQSYFTASMITDIIQWGALVVTNGEEAFFSCTNMNVSAKGVPRILSSSLRLFFYMCVSLHDNYFNEWDVSGVVDASFVFAKSSFDSDVSSWDVSSVVNMHGMFNITPFNQDISQWDVSSVADMSYMFNRAISFNQDLSRWDIANVTNMEYIFSSTALSVANYDAILIAWAAKPHQSNVDFGAQGVKYSSAAVSARNQLIADGWTITDGGLV